MTERPTVSLSKITFSSNQEFEFQPNEKIILVGSNNSGKSQTLREILRIANEGAAFNPTVVKNAEFKKSGSSAQLREFLQENAEFLNSSFRFKNWSVHESHIQFWDQPYLRNNLAIGFIKNVDANDRLKICEQQNSIGPNEQATRPQHILYDEPKLMEKLSGLFKRAFNLEIMFDYRGGSRMPIHVGRRPDAELVDRVGDDYVKSVRSNPLLDQQGDGMKSYAGILFETVVANLDINLLDEPEAFLHPPQMRRLGETLASEVTGQLIVATHSSDIMRGFLEGTKGNVRVLRIRRSDDVNVVCEAEPNVIVELWSQPELRYSNALEGVFHEQTIICEDDSDCRIFNAIGDYMAQFDVDHWKDTAYVPTGGKHGIKKVAEVLRKIGVPVKAIFDIDFLSEKNLVRDTVQAFGEDWATIEPYWSRVDAAVRDGVKPKSITEIKRTITEILNEADEGSLPRGKIIDEMKQTSAWAIVKKFGRMAIPVGKAQQNFTDLISRLSETGIFVIECGEVENFCRDIGLHGPKFAQKILSETEFNDDRLADLRAFTARVHKGKHGHL